MHASLWNHVYLFASFTVAKKKEVHGFHWTGVHLGHGGASGSLEYSVGFFFVVVGQGIYTWQEKGELCSPPDSLQHQGLQLSPCSHKARELIMYSVWWCLVWVMYCIPLLFSIKVCFELWAVLRLSIFEINVCTGVKGILVMSGLVLSFLHPLSTRRKTPNNATLVIILLFSQKNEAKSDSNTSLFTSAIYRPIKTKHRAVKKRHRTPTHF